NQRRWGPISSIPRLARAPGVRRATAASPPRTPKTPCLAAPYHAAPRLASPRHNSPTVSRPLAVGGEIPHDRQQHHQPEQRPERHPAEPGEDQDGHTERDEEERHADHGAAEQPQAEPGERAAAHGAPR